MARPKRTGSKKAAPTRSRRASSADAPGAPEERRTRAPRVRRESIEDPLFDWPEEDYETDPLRLERPATDIERDES